MSYIWTSGDRRLPALTPFSDETNGYLRMSFTSFIPLWPRIILTVVFLIGLVMGFLVWKTFRDVGATKQIHSYDCFIQAYPKGRISKQDYKDLHKLWFPSGDPTEYCKYIFNVFDYDKDGTIDFKEFICAFFLTLPGNSDDKLNCSCPRYHRQRKAIRHSEPRRSDPWQPVLTILDLLGIFRVYDIDKDGYITRDEMLKIVKSLHQMVGQMGELPEGEITPEEV